MAKDSDERIKLLQRIAQDKDKDEKIEEIEEGNEDEIKKRNLEEIKKALRKLTSEELEEERIKIEEELEQIKKEMNPDKEEEKQSKQASLEFLGVDSQIIKTKSKYSVLAYEPEPDSKTSGDALLIKMGSRDESSKGNSKDDELLQSLGSTD